uniref:Uncharacterized protein n=1 Tax=Anguilla anguilla TaxID=7936 RepID=A0A0E9WDD6_ANGAN
MSGAYITIPQGFRIDSKQEGHSTILQLVCTQILFFFFLLFW